MEAPTASKRFERYRPSVGQVMIRWGRIMEDTPYQLAELDLDTHELDDILQSLITARVEHTEDYLRRTQDDY